MVIFQDTEEYWQQHNFPLCLWPQKFDSQDERREWHQGHTSMARYKPRQGAVTSTIPTAEARILPSLSTRHPRANSLPCWFVWQNLCGGIHDGSDVKVRAGPGWSSHSHTQLPAFLTPRASPARKPSAKARMDLVSDRSSFRTSTWEFFVSARISLAADSPFSTSRQAMYTRAPGAKTNRQQCVQTLG